jgi:hypothetical protein
LIWVPLTWSASLLHWQSWIIRTFVLLVLLMVDHCVWNLWLSQFHQSFNICLSCIKMLFPLSVNFVHIFKFRKKSSYLEFLFIRASLRAYLTIVNERKWCYSRNIIFYTNFLFSFVCLEMYVSFTHIRIYFYIHVFRFKKEKNKLI